MHGVRLDGVAWATLTPEDSGGLFVCIGLVSCVCYGIAVAIDEIKIIGGRKQSTRKIQGRSGAHEFAAAFIVFILVDVVSLHVMPSLSVCMSCGKIIGGRKQCTRKAQGLPGAHEFAARDIRC